MIAPLFGSITRPLLSPLAIGLRDELFGAFTPRSLFNDGSIGVLYDNNDLTSFYLDAAGTTAATVNGLVGLQLDKSQAQVVARRNLLSFTEQLGAAPWSVATATVTADQIVAPDGTTTADLITATANGGNVRQFFTTTAGIRTFSCYVKKGNVASITFKIINIADAFIFNLDTGLVTGGVHANKSFVETVGNGWYRIGCWIDTGASTSYGPGIGLTTSGDTVYAWGFQMETGSTVSAYQKVVANEGGWMLGNHRYQTTTGSKPILRGTPTGAELFTAYGTPGAGWSVAGATGTATTASSALPTTTAATVGKHYRVTYTVTRSAGSVQLSFGGRTGVSRSAAGQYVEYFDNALNTNALTATGTGFTGTVRIDEVKDVSAGSVTAPYGLQYDGVDDFLQTASVNFTATDKMFVCAGVRKFSDSVGAVIASLGNVASVAGSFELNGPGTAAPNYVMQLRGNSSNSIYFYTTYAAPVTNVISVALDYAAAVGSEAVARVNGVTPTTATGVESGAGPFANQIMYFGRRTGTVSPYNGLDFGFVIVGKTLTAAQISSTERWMAQRTGVSI